MQRYIPWRFYIKVANVGHIREPGELNLEILLEQRTSRVLEYGLLLLTDAD